MKRWRFCTLHGKRSGPRSASKIRVQGVVAKSQPKISRSIRLNSSPSMRRMQRRVMLLSQNVLNRVTSGYNDSYFSLYSAALFCLKFTSQAPVPTDDPLQLPTQGESFFLHSLKPSLIPFSLLLNKDFYLTYFLSLCCPVFPCSECYSIYWTFIT